MELTSNKPYLLRAIYEWVVDNDATPHVVLFADNPLVQVPQHFVEHGKIVLNISPSAAKDLLIDNDGLSFSARFGGKPYSIYAPIGAVLALYASETSEGLSFEPEAFDDRPLAEDDEPPKTHLSDASADDESVTAETSKSKKKSKRPSLKVVK